MKSSSLYVRTFISVFVFFLILAAFVFVLSGTIKYRNGWMFLFSFFTPTLFITLYFLYKDPDLIERRVKPAETRVQQIIGQSIALLVFFVGLIGVSVLDYRFGWSYVSPALSVVANFVILLGFGIVFFVFRANSYTSKSIEIMNGQKIITTGPYAVVRHPMYSGAVLIIISIPLALGSLYGLISSVSLFFIIVLRLLDEEKLLKSGLDGYNQYCQKTKYRLIPYIW